MVMQPSVKKEKLDDVQMCYASKGYSGKWTKCETETNTPETIGILTKKFRWISGYIWAQLSSIRM